MAFQGRHGARPAEREHAQEFKIDLEVECDMHKPAESDDLADALDYTRLRAIVRDVVEGPHVNLIETLAHRIAQRVLDEPGVTSASVRVAKRPPSMQPIDSAAVHIKRTRAGSE
jgi:dihydroneopterin aldolase